MPRWKGLYPFLLETALPGFENSIFTKIQLKARLKNTFYVFCDGDWTHYDWLNSHWPENTHNYFWNILFSKRSLLPCYRQTITLSHDKMTHFYDPSSYPPVLQLRAESLRALASGLSSMPTRGEMFCHGVWTFNGLSSLQQTPSEWALSHANAHNSMSSSPEKA